MNFFIVESPFQLLSAIEANNYYSNEENILIIKYAPEKSNSKNNEQLKLLKSLIIWSKIIEIENSSSFLMANLKLVFQIKEIQNKFTHIDKIFIGEYRSWFMRQYFNILNPISCFALDDGNMTIELQKSYIPTGKYYEIKTWKSVLKRLLHKLILLFFKSKQVKNRLDINLFTCFDLKPYSEKQTLIKHSFEYLKKQNKSKEVLKNVVYFFGGNLSETGVISEENEIRELIEIQKYYVEKNIKLIYLPHRRESIKKLDYLENELNIEFRYSTYPAEVEFIIMDALPQYLASFMSTALYTVSKIVDFEDVIAFKLPFEKINDMYLQDIISAYDDYEKTIKVINLNELI